MADQELQALKDRTLQDNQVIYFEGCWRFINYSDELLTTGWRSLEMTLKDKNDIAFRPSSLIIMHDRYCKFKGIEPRKYIPAFLTPEQIYDAHLTHLHEGSMPYNPQGRRFKSKEAVADALRKGEIIPEIWKEVAHHTLSPAQIIGMYSLSVNLARIWLRKNSKPHLSQQSKTF